MSYTEEFEFRPRPLPSDGMPLGLRGAGRVICGAMPIQQADISPSFWIGWCKSGQICVSLNGKQLEVNEGRAIVILPNTSNQLSVTKDPTEFYWCSIDGDDCGDIASKLGLENGVFDAGSIPENLIKEWIKKLPSNSGRIERELSAAAYELLYSVAREVKSRSVDPLFADIQNYIDKNVNNSDLTVDCISEYFSIHRSTLSSIFKKNTQMCAKEYITRTRINKAEHLLTTTDDKISEVALNSGFSDPNYFSRMFRKIRGMTPREYRDAISVK